MWSRKHRLFLEAPETMCGYELAEVLGVADAFTALVRASTMHPEVLAAFAGAGLPQHP